MFGTSVICLLLFGLEIQGLCPPETECFGHGVYDKKNQTCICSSSIREIAPYTGDCCESIGCKPNASCKHGKCDHDGVTCERCQTGWSGTNCTNVTSCFPWFSCEHGSCVKSRSLCECEAGWVGDLCDKTVCLVSCKFGSCPKDPMKCECHENYYGSACEKSICGEGWECENGGYCTDYHHCVCPRDYTGPKCEIVEECSVPCEHGTCPSKADVCECETNWGPPGDCSVYNGPCSNCSSKSGKCKTGPNKCDCNPGYIGSDCSAQECDGCEHGRCYHGSHGKSCACDSGWGNELREVPGFDPTHGPCTRVEYCMEPCIHGKCPNDPYICKCTEPYVGTHCEVMKCPVCCPPQTCDCSYPHHVRCRYTWHHDCCLVKSCFRGDTLVHTAQGLVPIENIREGDMVVTRHEGEDSSVTHLRRVDQVRKRIVPTIDLVVLRTGDEDIWATPDHLFFEKGTESWISAGNLTTSHSLYGSGGREVKLRYHMEASQLLASSNGDNVTTVYDLSVYEYDRYSIGKAGLLVSSCNQLVDLKARDTAMWGLKKPILRILRPTKRPPHVSEFPIILVLCAVLGFLFLVLIIAFLAKKYAHHGRGSMDQEPLIPNTQTPEKGTPGTYKSEVQIHLRGQ